MLRTALRTSLALLTASILLIGCDSPPPDFNEGIVTISGRVIDETSRAPLNDINVSLKVNGSWLTDLSGPSDNAAGVVQNGVDDGDFYFDNLPEGSDFVLVISDTNSNYASKYYIGKTELRETDTVDGSITQDLGVFELVGETDVTITLRNAQDNSALSGLSLYYNPVEVLPGGNDTLQSNSISDISATETAGDGVYTFSVPDDGVARTVYINTTQINGINYVPYDGSSIDNKALTQIASGADQTIYFIPENNSQFNLTLYLVDESGNDVEIPNAVLALTNNKDNSTLYAYKSGTAANQYTATLTAQDATGSSFGLTLQNLDTNSDGFFDTQAQHITVNPLSFDAGSFDSQTRTLTQVVEILPILYNQDINATVLSEAADFQAGVESKLIIGFDRPVQLIHEPSVSYYEVSESAPKIALNDPAAVYSDLDTSGNPIAPLYEYIPVNTNPGDEGTYSFQIDSMGTLAKTSQLGDSSNKLDSPFETQYDSIGTTVTGLTTRMRANNTILELELDPATVLADHQYSFLVSVEGLLADAPRLVLQETVTAQSPATLTSLNQLSIDDGNFKDTTTRDLGDATQEQYLAGATPHKSQLFASLGNYWNGTANTTAYLNYVNYQDTGAFSPNPTQLSSGLYLVSPVKLEGSAEIVEYTETYQSAGVTTSSSYTPNSMQYIFGLDYQSGSNVGLAPDNFDAGGEIGNIASTKYYLLNKPANHYLESVGNLTGVYGAAGAVGGVDVGSEGVYYLYQLPSLPTAYGGYISDVTLDLKVKGGNGAVITGQKLFAVK